MAPILWVLRVFRALARLIGNFARAIDGVFGPIVLGHLPGRRRRHNRRMLVWHRSGFTAFLPEIKNAQASDNEEEQVTPHTFY